MLICFVDARLRDTRRGILSRSTVSRSPRVFGRAKVGLFSIGLAEYAEKLIIDGKTVPLRPNYNVMNNNLILLILMSAGLLLMVFAVMILLRLSKMKDAELRNSGKYEMKIQALKIIMPLKVQAYERFLLYLERVQLPQLVKRIYAPGMEKGTLHLLLIKNVREEFEHNLAQQLYVSNTTWNAVVNAKEELVNQINTTFEQLKDEEDVSILAQSLVALPNPMVEQAIVVLKHDFAKLL